MKLSEDIVLNGKRAMARSYAKINLTLDKSRSAMQLYFLDDLTSEVISKYNKIIELTEMNINIYKDIKEVIGK